MKTFTFCMECFKEFGQPSSEPIVMDYYDDGIAYAECTKGHKSAIILVRHKFDILLESAANALIDNYTIEAASSLSAAYERFFEYAINVFCKNKSINKKEFEETFKQVAKQSERQTGAFLFLYLILLGNSYQLSKKIPELRNRIVHQGYIPKPEEVIEFGEHIFQELNKIARILREKFQKEMQVVEDDILNSKYQSTRIPVNTPRTASIGGTFFSLLTAKEKNFQETLDVYKGVRKSILGAIPRMEQYRQAAAILSQTPLKDLS